MSYLITSAAKHNKTYLSKTTFNKYLYKNFNKLLMKKFIAALFSQNVIIMISMKIKHCIEFQRTYWKFILS